MHREATPRDDEAEPPKRVGNLAGKPEAFRSSGGKAERPGELQ